MNAMITCALLACLSPWTATPVAAPQGVQVGDVLRFPFQRPLLNGMGTKSLEDLRGKPVFIEFWGRSTLPLDDIIRESLAWQKAYGDDLTVLFVEVEEATELQVTSLLLKKKWLGGSAMWTTERPCYVGLAGGLPQFVLLSSEGAVLLKGTSQVMELGYPNKVVEAIEDTFRAEVKLRRKGPEELPPALTAAWEAFSKGQVKEAFELAQSLIDDPKSDKALAVHVEEARGVFRARIERRLRRTTWQIENGYLLQAEAELERLDEQLDAEKALASKWSELNDALHDESLQTEWKAARAFAKLEKTIYKKGSKSPLIKKLAKLVKKHPGTKSAERAQRFFDAAQISPYR